MIEMASVISDYSIKNKLYANDAIKWAVIEYGKKKGNKLYDLTGVSPSPETEKEKGIRRFKEKWGGKLINYHTFSK
jgi:lipid II:glycine glycyltransferase (peptidoglycan interpeptide bridge formation enzyme)